jgi:hypothetical protein
MIHDRVASGEAKLAHVGGGQVNGFGRGPFVGPLGIFDYDDPVSIRARKYITGTHVLLEEIDEATDRLPRLSSVTVGGVRGLRSKLPKQDDM